MTGFALTRFEVRELARSIGQAVVVMPDGNAESLILDIFTVIHRRRPDVTLVQWRELISEYT
jgi:hypothetical protein